MRILILALTLSLLSTQLSHAQVDVAFPSQSVNYKVVEDNPKDLNHLWIHVQPLTIDAMQMNSVVGSGLELTYLPIPKLELKGGIKGNLINAFDLQRTAAIRNAQITTQSSKREQDQMVITNSFSRFYSFEIGGIYQLSENEKDGSSKIILGDNAVPGNTSFPEIIDVNSKIRQIWGARLGINSMSTAVSLQKAIDQQEVTLSGSSGTQLSNKGTASNSGFKTPLNANELFTNFSSTGFHVGAAFQMIKNISIKTDRQGIVSNNSILTFYADLLINPWTKLDNLNARVVGQSANESFDVSPIKTNKLGGRIGADVRYNQASFISLGAELGYRPAIQSQGWYGLIKLSIPTFSFGPSKRKVASNVGKNQSLTQ